MTLEKKKMAIIEKVIQTEDELSLDKLMSLLFPNNDNRRKEAIVLDNGFVIEPIDETLDIDKIIAEQGKSNKKLSDAWSNLDHSIFDDEDWEEIVKDLKI